MIYQPVFILASFVLPLTAQVPSGTATLTEARNYLKETVPHPSYGIAVIMRSRGATDQTVLARANLYSKQIDAIAVLTADKAPADVEYIIPFLGYAADPGAESIKGSYAESLEESKKEYPVFDAMFNMPCSSSSLSSFCLDSTHSLSSRLTAFAALKFVDPQKFVSIQSQMEQDLETNKPESRGVINSIKESSFMFCGMIGAN